MKVIRLELNLLRIGNKFIGENMRPISTPALGKQNFNILLRRLFALPDTTIESAPAHQVRLWLNKVGLELKRERNRGSVQHYRYDMNRHLALAAARNALAMRLEELEK